MHTPSTYGFQKRNICILFSGCVATGNSRCSVFVPPLPTIRRPGRGSVRACIILLYTGPVGLIDSSTATPGQETNQWQDANTDERERQTVAMFFGHVDHNNTYIISWHNITINNIMYYYYNIQSVARETVFRFIVCTRADIIIIVIIIICSPHHNIIILKRPFGHPIFRFRTASSCCSKCIILLWILYTWSLTWQY